jgi:hypothetical protein
MTVAKQLQKLDPTVTQYMYEFGWQAVCLIIY